MGRDGGAKCSKNGNPELGTLGSFLFRGPWQMGTILETRQFMTQAFLPLAHYIHQLPLSLQLGPSDTLVYNFLSRSPKS